MPVGRRGQGHLGIWLKVTVLVIRGINDDAAELPEMAADHRWRPLPGLRRRSCWNWPGTFRRDVIAIPVQGVRRLVTIPSIVPYLPAGPLSSLGGPPTLRG
jgi:hypothetical protein